MAEGESLSQHAAAASQRALKMADVAPEEVDLIILATSSPDDLFGSACQVRIMLSGLHAVACKEQASQCLMEWSMTPGARTADQQLHGWNSAQGLHCSSFRGQSLCHELLIICHALCNCGSGIARSVWHAPVWLKACAVMQSSWQRCCSISILGERNRWPLLLCRYKQ